MKKLSKSLEDRLHKIKDKYPKFKIDLVRKDLISLPSLHPSWKGNTNDEKRHSFLNDLEK